MKNLSLLLPLLLGVLIIVAQDIPLPEHPNPIHYRSQWINLNGPWAFQFDRDGSGMADRWYDGNVAFEEEIMVPFSWGATLSGLSNDADIGWYSREVIVSPEWRQQRVFLIIGAADWETHVWIDGQLLGTHRGGYVPFEFELTDHIDWGKPQRITVRVDDVRRPFTLYGKQGYGDARGIWQTSYLEARGEEYISQIQVTPDIDASAAAVKVVLPDYVISDTELGISIADAEGTSTIEAMVQFKKGQREATTIIRIPNARLWSLEDPFLYDIMVTRGDDTLHSYFGMRKISVVDLPGIHAPYVALNNKPIYLQMALDQSYHPDGFYTFPSEQFIIDEIKRSKSIGLNGIRTHIKVEIPRKLYWADKLGLLVMEDLPNSWGEPEERMRREATYTLEEMIKRDYNHPSIFSWIVMNETWGLFTKQEGTSKYLPETQRWVVSLYHLAKALDPTRLVEDNSICCGIGHTVTDLYSWHVYLPGYQWEQYLQQISDSSFVGSGYQYEEGYLQGKEPNINSECGNVWGYKGSTGDVDWSYDYHRMINSFRTFPKIAGWLYTEHHDVINEWNGYWRFDRSEKHTGLSEIVPEMSLSDMHADVYISTGQNITYSAVAGEMVDIPLYISAMTDREMGTALSLDYQMDIHTVWGQRIQGAVSGSLEVPYRPWIQEHLPALGLEMPDYNGLATVSLILRASDGTVLHRNFVHISITGGALPEGVSTYSTLPSDYSDASWSQKMWRVLDGTKMNGAGSGYFEYRIEIPQSAHILKSQNAYFQTEASAKELFVKDQEAYQEDQDFMKGSRVASSSNPNSYPMTDEKMTPSDIEVSINGIKAGSFVLPDDPADHRGVLSWHNQPEDQTLHEAGSYGYPIVIKLTRAMKKSIHKSGYATIRIAAMGTGGIAIYGSDFGRLPYNPSIVIRH